jgi:GR25 family glycosyltransferase involved in LPS biosynthesis
MKKIQCKYFFYNFWNDFHGKSFVTSDHQISEIITETSMIHFLMPFLNNHSDNYFNPVRAQSIEDANLIVYSCFGQAEQKLRELKRKNINNPLIIQWTGEARILDSNFEFTDLLLGSDINDNQKNFFSFLALLYLKHVMLLHPSLRSCIKEANAVNEDNVGNAVNEGNVANEGNVGNAVKEDNVAKVERKFCSMFCSYLCSPRREIFEIINNYKTVNGFGSAFRSRVHGFYWDLEYIKKLSEFKFVICCENSYRSGYNTEKIINPILAGCIPIYWGAPTIFNFVRKERILYLEKDFENLEQIMQMIKYLDSDNIAFEAMIKEQPFIYSTLEEIEEKVVGSTEHNKKVLEQLFLDHFNNLEKSEVSVSLEIPESLEKIETLQKTETSEKSEANNFNDKFQIPLLLINLDKSTDRLLTMTEQFTKYNVLLYNRIKAVDGYKLVGPIPDDITDDLTDHIKFNIIGKVSETKLGAIGCTLSHLKSIKTASKMNHSCVIVMEDDTDISLMDQWNMTYKNICKNAPDDWEILQMYTSNMQVIKQYYRHDMANQYIRRDDSAWSTGTYIINRKGMDKILQQYYDEKNDTFNIGGEITADILIYKGLITYLYTTPTVCTMDDRFISIISPHKHDEHGIASSKYIREYYNPMI